MKKIITIISIITVFCLASSNLIFAQDKILPKESINPDQPLAYKFKRVKEKIGLIVRFSPKSKVYYLSELVEKRFDEIVYIAANKNLEYIETTSRRHEAFVGELVELINSTGSEDKKLETINKFKYQIGELEKLRDLYSANTGEWLLLQNNINTLQICSAKLT